MFISLLNMFLIPLTAHIFACHVKHDAIMSTYYQGQLFTNLGKYSAVCCPQFLVQSQTPGLHPFLNETPMAPMQMSVLGSAKQRECTKEHYTLWIPLHYTTLCMILYKIFKIHVRFKYYSRVVVCWFQLLKCEDLMLFLICLIKFNMCGFWKVGWTKREVVRCDDTLLSLQLIVRSKEGSY